MNGMPTIYRIAAFSSRLVISLALVLGLIGELHASPGANLSQVEPASPLQVQQAGAEISVSWSSHGLPVDSPQNWLPTQWFNGYDLPVTTITVRAESTLPPTVKVHHQSSQPSAWLPTLSAPLSPPALDFVPDELPVHQTESAALPDQPLQLIRQGSLRGLQIAVFAFAPIYQDNNSGDIRALTAFQATIEGAQVIETNAAELLTTANATELAASAYMATAVSPSPVVAAQAVKIIVSEQGIQEIHAADLAAVGISNANVDRLQIRQRNGQIPLHILDTNSNGSFDGNDLLRFYAPAPGDRWNLTSVYWLLIGSDKGLRMELRDVPSQGAPVRDTAYQSGVWEDNRLYDSLVAGHDGDHWFHLDARVDETMQGIASTYPAFSPTVSTSLPLAASDSLPALFTLYTTVSDVRTRDSSGRINSLPTVPHKLLVQAGNYSRTDDADDWVIDFSEHSRLDATRTISIPVSASEIAIRLVADGNRMAVKFDDVAWKHPVQLNFQSGGAQFTGVPGTWRYRLINVPADHTLYDVTDPNAVQILSAESSALTAASQSSANATVFFQDGPDVHSYVVAATGAIQTPVLEEHAPFDFNAVGGAHAIYIGPAAFEATLQPLIDLRVTQGYKTVFIDIEDIYAGWSSGEIDPEAIRSFLRYAAGTWAPAPLSVVLVGDSTWDPHDYEGIGNPNIVPAYLAPVDPWLGETACETCFVQLDGENPLDESPFLIDMWIGRFPVIDTGELENVVEKIVSYESADDAVAEWRGRSLFLADDYVRPDGQTDPAGNFAALTENIIKLQPTNLDTIRHYFNAEVDMSILPPILQTFLASILPWVEPNADRALQRTIDYINAGTGLLTYTGHSNWWQYARLGEEIGEARLFGWVDVPRLRNRDQYFIGLSMTCYTAQFIKPATLHYTLDERLVLAENAGAVAMWGASGLAVAFGHDYLQEGFHRALWSGPPLQTPLGKAVQAGYTELVTHGTCCQDVAHTFLLLGDPLMNVRVHPTEAIHIPIIESQQ